MPRYDAAIAITLKITTQITVRARDEDTAAERINAMIADAQFGTLSWDIMDARVKNLLWTEDEMDMFIDGIEGEE